MLQSFFDDGRGSTVGQVRTSLLLVRLSMVGTPGQQAVFPGIGCVACVIGKAEPPTPGSWVCPAESCVASQ
jgi:hypothetical protein